MRKKVGKNFLLETLDFLKTIDRKKVEMELY